MLKTNQRQLFHGC